MGEDNWIRKCNFTMIKCSNEKLSQVINTVIFFNFKVLTVQSALGITRLSILLKKVLRDNIAN